MGCINKVVVQERGIQSLYHFTQADNLENILKYGILTRKELNEQSIAYFQCDNDRAEGHLDSVSLSISHPNYKMFYLQRNKHPNKTWAVLDINPEDILCNNDIRCAFYWTNAADSRMKCLNPFDLEGAKSFETLFGNWPLNISRKDSEPSERRKTLYDRFPTNPQAEILVFHSIEPSAIRRIFFQNEEDMGRYQNIITQKPCKKCEVVFRQRYDSADWGTYCG